MISIIIPTYNEAENIDSLCKEILKHLPAGNIIIVDDNSRDGTEKIVNSLAQKNSRIKFITRKGKARSFSQSYIEGFKMAFATNADYIVQMDADFSHNPKYLSIIIDELKKYDVVVGSRYIEGGKTENWSLLRRLISRGGNLYVKLITGLPLADSTAGFVGWRAEALKKINLDKIRSNGYAFQIEMKYRTRKNNCKIKEIPIIFTDRKFGVSKMSKKIVFEAAIACLKLLIGSKYNRQKNNEQVNDEEIKNYYRNIENYDWTYISDNFIGIEALFHRNRSKIITNLINKYGIKNGKYLDLGCGTGLITRCLPSGSIGLDINPRNIKKAKMYAPHINFIQGDIEKTNLPDNEFDVIISTEILEHLLDPAKALAEIKRILKPEGVLIGSVPSDGILWKLRFLSSTCGTKEPYHKHYPKSEIKKILEHNFGEVKILGSGLKMSWFFICQKKYNENQQL